MPKLRKQLSSTSGVDQSGNEFTLTETDIQPYIDNPELAQMEADVTKARYGGSAIQDSGPPGPPGPPDGVQPVSNAPYQKPEGPMGAMPDFSRRNDFERSVFKQLKTENMPTGNPFEFDTVAAMNALSKQDLPELFARVFQGQVTWQDRHLLDDDQKKFWTSQVKAYRAHLKNSLDSEKATAITSYNQMMNQFDNAAKAYGAARKAVAEKTEKFAKGQRQQQQDTAQGLKRRTEILSKMRELTQSIFDAEATNPLAEEEKQAYAAELQALRTELQVLNANMGIKTKKKAPAPRSEISNAANAGEAQTPEKTIVRKKIPEQGKNVVTKKVPKSTGKGGKRPVATAIYKGRKIIKYSDGSRAYADEIK